jgi:hypothetical protein
MGRINIWDVPGPANGETSISQTAVMRGTPLQTVEAGKMEYEARPEPYLFTWYTTNGHTQTGDWIGGYDTNQDGFIQYGGSVAPGMSLAPWESAEGGNQYSLDVRIQLWQGNWWIRAANEWVGYYPYCVGAMTPPCGAQGTIFSENGIRDGADRLDWYGEVFDSTAPAPTSTDMGSGDFASAGWQQAAYFRNLLYFWEPNIVWWFDSGSLRVTDPACYSGAGPYYSNTAAWRNWFYFGGPGAEASRCR